MLTINDAGMPAGFTPLPHAVEARYTITDADAWLSLAVPSLDD